MSQGNRLRKGTYAHIAPTDIVGVEIDKTLNPPRPKVDKSVLELDQVDNTSDLDKPISTATQGALDSKLDIDGKAVDSSLLNGVAESVDAVADTIVKRHGNGYIYGSYFNQAQGQSQAPSATEGQIMYRNNDNFLRSCTPAQLKDLLITGHRENTVNKVLASGYLAVSDASTYSLQRTFNIYLYGKLSTGRYQLVFNTHTNDTNYIVLASSANPTAYYMAEITRNTGYIILEVRNRGTSAAQDLGFINFACIKKDTGL